MISIIIPVYQMEKYIERCMESILCQTYQDFEVILVDDGSRDNSPAICDDYAETYEKVSVIHQKNKGVSAARNTGMRAAKGEFIAFIDPDDWIHKEYLQRLNENIGDCDLCCCSYSKVSKYQMGKTVKRAVPEFWGIDEALITDRSRAYVWGKLYRRKSIGGLKFVEGMRSSEDRAFNAAFLVKAPDCKVCYFNEKLYYYYQHAESITADRDFTDLPAINEMYKTAVWNRHELLLLYVIDWLRYKIRTGSHIGCPPDYDTVERYLKRSIWGVRFAVRDPQLRKDLIMWLRNSEYPEELYPLQGRKLV